MNDTKTYEWGHAGRLRAYRDYLGLTVQEMAERLGMARRSYQRMETGTAAVPVSLWDTIDGIVEDFEKAVTRLVRTPDGNDATVIVELAEDASMWQRNVVARAMIAALPGQIDVKLPDDHTAEQEMDG